jgi:regulatory protein
LLISRIEPVPRHPDRVRVHLAGNRAPLELTRLVAEEAGLRPGLVLDDLAVARLRQRDEFQDALDRALHFLGSRPRSEREIRTRLGRAGVGPDLLEQVVDKLRQHGLVDDAAFARYWIDNRERFSPRGARAIKAELRQKGLTSEVITEEVEEAESVDEEGGARTVALKQAKRFAKLDRQAFRQKMWAVLARRGFDFDAINPAIDEAWQVVSGGPADDDTSDDDTSDE